MSVEAAETTTARGAQSRRSAEADCLVRPTRPKQSRPVWGADNRQEDTVAENNLRPDTFPTMDSQALVIFVIVCCFVKDIYFLHSIFHLQLSSQPKKVFFVPIRSVFALEKAGPSHYEIRPGEAAKRIIYRMR